MTSENGCPGMGWDPFGEGFSSGGFMGAGGGRVQISKFPIPQNAQGAFHVKPTPKVRQALSFRTPGIFRERETAEKSVYSKSDDFKKLSVLAQILSLL